MIGDEGSGYWIGRESLAAVMRASDGRGPETRLTAEILAHFNVDDESRLPRIVYDREHAAGQRRGARTDRAAGRRTGRRGGDADSGARGRGAGARRPLGGDAPRDARRRVQRSISPAASFASSRGSPTSCRDGSSRSRRGRRSRLLDEEPAVGAVWLALAEARGGARVPRYKTVMANGSWLMVSDRWRAIAMPLAISHERVRVFGTADALARALAVDIARRLAANPRLVLGLPTGRTPIPLYRELVRLHRAGRADFSRATTFNLDEFLGLAPRDPRSYRAFMQRHLFDHVNLPPRRIHFLNGATRDVARECRRYERAIERAGGIDLQILGLGMNGHIGFNEPARALVARTHRTAAEAGDAPRQRGAVRQPRRRGPARGAVDGDGDDSSRAADRAARDRRDQGALRPADDRGTGDAAAAGIVPAAAPVRGDLAGSGSRGEAANYPTRSSSLSRSSTSSPIASRTTSCARRRRESDCV